MALVASSAEEEATSSNVSSSPFSYHVFLSFRGEDTRKTFTDHLYTALTNAEFRIFRDDDELARGEDIKLDLERAIQQSQSSVIVFSKDYASSGWCLDELVMILRRKTTSNNHVVLPVFYDIDPSHLRKQTGTVGKAFVKHQKKQSPEKLNRWREALTQTADLPGMVLQNQADGHEAKFIKKIVKVIQDKLCRVPSSVTPYLVGIQYHVEHINSWLQDGSSNVGIWVICGIGGIGKTTIAEVVYNSNFQRFEGSSFIENVREISKQFNGLVQIQKQLLSDILSGRKVKIQSVSEGIMKIKDVIGSKKVLVVLDDIDNAGQLDAVLSMRDCFCPGSKIILTTRHAGLLEARKVDMVYMVNFLNDDHALELFSWHCFRQDQPIEGYMEFSERVVSHCGGLPLALQTLGSSLSGKSLDVWESALKKLRTISNNEMLSKLRISYDSLQDDHDQNLFLHIACFFIGKEKDVIVKVLDECDFYTIVGIENLIDRSLIFCDGYNKMRMHQMIRDMGREIVRLESKYPEKRSRLWHHRDSFNVLREKIGSKRIEGLALNMHMYLADTPSRTSNDVVLETSSFTVMRKLKLLELCDVHVGGSYEEFPKGLRWLCWAEFPPEYIPTDFPLDNLVVLEMPSSHLRQGWKGMKNQLPSLKILDLSHSLYLTEVGDFSLVPNLEKLILEHCPSLVEIHESIGNLDSLVYVNMKDCTTISKLPESFSMLISLEMLVVSGCSNLYEFQMQMSKLVSLKVLEVDEVPINRLLTTTGEVMPLPGKSLHNFWASFPSTLVDLSLRKCGLSDDAFPLSCSNLCSLQKLDLSMNPISGLPDCIRGLGGIDLLKLQNCTGLKSLVRLPKVRVLDMWDSHSLEKITFQSSSCIPKRIDMYLTERSKLAEIEHWFKMEPIKVDVKMINLLGLSNLKPMEGIKMYNASLYTMEKMHHIQGVSEYGIFNTFLLGNEVPGEFSHRSSGASSISLTVPLLPPNLRIRGFNFFSVYAKSKGPRSGRLPNHPVMIRFTNKSKSLKWIYGPSFYGIPSEEKDMIWFSHWKLGSRLEAGDEVTVSVFTAHQQHFHVKEWGIQIVEEQEDQMAITDNSSDNTNSCDDPDQDVNECISGDLLKYQVMPGTYLLTGGPVEENRDMHNSWIYESDWFNNMCEDPAEGSEESQQQQRQGESNMTLAAKAELAERICIGCKSVIVAVIQWSIGLFSRQSEGSDGS